MRMYKISGENAREIRKRMERVKDVGAYRRLQAAALRGEGKKNEEIAEITKFNSDWVGQLAKIYCREGIEALIEDGRKGGNNRNMSDEEAASFMSQFEETAKKGQILTVEEIAAAYDKAVGREHESKSTVYYLLHKMGWRKLMPRSKHPNKASDEEIEASKKLTSESES
jgi:transposase